MRSINASADAAIVNSLAIDRHDAAAVAFAKKFKQPVSIFVDRFANAFERESLFRSRQVR